MVTPGLIVVIDEFIVVTLGFEVITLGFEVVNLGFEVVVVGSGQDRGKTPLRLRVFSFYFPHAEFSS